MTRAVVPLVGLLLALGCTTTNIKFPAREYLVRHLKGRLDLQDETYKARERCKYIRASLLAPGTQVPVVLPTPAKIEEKRVKCDELDARMKDADAWDLIVIDASLKGDTINREQLENVGAVVGPILKLAADILL